MPAAGLAFLGGAVGGPEVLVIAVVVLILFGPKRLPEIARTIGKTLAQLRRSADEFKDQVTREVDESAAPPAALQPGDAPVSEAEPAGPPSRNASLTEPRVPSGEPSPAKEMRDGVGQ